MFQVCIDQLFKPQEARYDLAIIELAETIPYHFSHLGFGYNDHMAVGMPLFRAGYQHRYVLDIATSTLTKKGYRIYNMPFHVASVTDNCLFDDREHTTTGEAGEYMF